MTLLKEKLKAEFGHTATLLKHESGIWKSREFGARLKATVRPAVLGWPHSLDNSSIGLGSGAFALIAGLVLFAYLAYRNLTMECVFRQIWLSRLRRKAMLSDIQLHTTLFCFRGHHCFTLLPPATNYDCQPPNTYTGPGMGAAQSYHSATVLGGKQKIARLWGCHGDHGARPQLHCYVSFSTNLLLYDS